MQYIPPIDSVNPDAPYVDGNETTGTEGSPVSAAAIEHPQREIVNAIIAGGLVPDKDKQNQLAKIIEQLKLSTPDLSHLPVYPTIQSANNKFVVTNDNGGAFVINTGQSWVIRGSKAYNTDTYSQADRTLSYLANKTYHLRWSAPNGFSLNDLTDSQYNPSSLDEVSTTFDSSYDDILIARVVTDASNTAVITTLANIDDLQMTTLLKEEVSITSPGYEWWHQPLVHLNWARTPVLVMSQMGMTVAGTYGAIEPINLETRNAVSLAGSYGWQNQTAVRTRYTFSPIGYLDTNAAGQTRVCTVVTQIGLRG